MAGLVPMIADQPGIGPSLDQLIERAVATRRAMGDQGAIEDVGEARGEAKAQQGAHSKDVLAATAGVR